ncbi:MAG: penicillin-binding protein 2 [Acidiferrobacterales bacterium]|nr:penicillin-binding protein 2 [Acidiferrobacterales bacterium]
MANSRKASSASRTRKTAKPKAQSKASQNSKRINKTAKARVSAKELVLPVSSWRYKTIALFFMCMFGALIARAVFLQVIDTEYLQSQGDARYLRVQKEPPTRGMIVDRNGQPLAISTPVDSIWMHPATILEQQDEYAYKKLSELLGTDRDAILSKARQYKSKQFVYLKRQLSPQTAQQILDLEVPGIQSVREYKRYYPAGPVLGHLLGFTNIDNEGQEGLELAFNKELTGRSGRTQVLQDKVGHVVEYVEQLEAVEHGQNIKLSIDSRIQYLAYRYLQAAVKKHQANAASLVALDAKTGEILAMVSAPDFNPNDRSDLTSSRFRNRSITDSYEPGSTMKPFTVAMALDKGVIQPDTQIDAEPGHMYIGRTRISDTKNHGILSTSEVIQKSSNVASAKIAMMLEPRDLYDVYKGLGFGETNGLKLQGETKGILANRKEWRPIEHATLSYGYGLSVNTLQLARSYQALANDGVMLPVSLTPVGEIPKGKRVFKSETASAVAKMMESVVGDDGTAPKAQVEQYRVAGKTGTSHRVENGQYQDDSYMSVFAGFAPVSDPDIVLVVTVDDPRGIDYYGGLVAAPVFSKVVEGALRFRDVSPDAILEPESESEPIKLMITRPEPVAMIEQGSEQ